MDATALAHRRVYIIDDLLGAILLIATVALGVLLDLTRRQICAVYQLAFTLCAATAFFLVGGLIDHHLSNEQLKLALYGSYLSGSSLMTSYIYVPIAASLGVSLVFLASISTCTTCDCCCLRGGTSSSSSSSPTAAATLHQRCFRSRIRATSSLYSACFVWLYVAIGTRLNVRLRESAINPVGGTVHWMLLRSPFYLALAHVGSLLLVGLKIFLQHADKSPHPPRNRMEFTTDAHDGSGLLLSMSASAATTSSKAAATTAMVEELMRPPPAKNFALAPRRLSDATPLKQSLPRSPQSAAATLAMSTGKGESRASPRHTTAAASGPMSSLSSKGAARRHGVNHTTTTNNNNREPQKGGDVSTLISSDSDSDDGVLRPSFRPSSRGSDSAATGSSSSSSSSTNLRSSTTKTLPPRHSQLATTTSGSMVRKRPSGGSSSMASGYSSSPPPSPTHSTASSSSASRSAALRATRATTLTRPGSASSSSSASSATTRPRLTSRGSSSSTTVLSDNDDHVLSRFEAYGSGNESHYTTSEYRATASAGIRRRAPSLAMAGTGTGAGMAAMRRPPFIVATSNRSSEWIECLDETTGSVYYYNTLTGESRWKEQ